MKLQLILRVSPCILVAGLTLVSILTDIMLAHSYRELIEDAETVIDTVIDDLYAQVNETGNGGFFRWTEQMVI